MSNKTYYTPDIEEFHVGFELEVKDTNIDIGPDVWGKGVYSLDDFPEGTSWSLRAVLPQGIIRVKHLDREDIEKEGFCSNRPYDGMFRSKKHFKHGSIDDYVLNLDFNSENGWVEISFVTHWGFEDIFQGKINNISELRMILKMVGYEGRK